MKPKMTKQVDPNTGERVTLCECPEKFIMEMEKKLVVHNQELNKFVVLAQQYTDISKKFFQSKEDILTSDKAFKDKMQWVAKELGLPKAEPWTFNIQLKCFELREPPEVQPLTPSQMQGGLGARP